MSTNAMHVARTGLDAQQTRMQVIANNLANVNTVAFKRDRANFEDLFYRHEVLPGSLDANFETLLYQTHRPGGAQTSDTTALTSPLAIGTGVRVVATEKIHTQGGLNTTGNAMDLAIDGQGFFQVVMPDVFPSWPAERQSQSPVGYDSGWWWRHHGRSGCAC